jgi:ribosome-associated heat shock protein Hsp15
METVRMDKWLWAARFFKTRALASDACDLGRIESNSHRAKAARDVHVGDMLRIKTEAGEFLVEVLLLSEVRGPAQVAQTLYRETTESRELRLKLAEEHKAMLKLGVITEGRPNKRDRQERSRLRGKIHRF